MNQNEDEEIINNDEKNTKPIKKNNISLGKKIIQDKMILKGNVGNKNTSLKPKASKTLTDNNNEKINDFGKSKFNNLSKNTLPSSLGMASELIKNSKDENGNQKSLTEQAKTIVKEKAKVEVKKKLYTWIMANLPIILPVVGIILGIILAIIILIIIILMIASMEQNETNYSCSTISMNQTSLSESDFVTKVEASVSIDSRFSIFATNAKKIYELATSNNINPELVLIRAQAEGFSPGLSNYNYWGLGCSNGGGKKACLSYSSFDQGVLGFINNISKYATIQDMMSKYAYIGSQWYNPGSSSSGGCYYFSYIKEYMSENRASTVEAACNKSCSGLTCLATTTEDQEAYTQWQVQKMVKIRENIFGIGEDNCQESGPIDNDGSGDIGSKVSAYAVKTYDSYLYDQSRRMNTGYVDCSSMVYRAYMAYNVLLGGNPQTANTASGEFVWCQSNGKLISESELRAGDLIYYNKGASYATGRPNGIGHVEMYIGNGQKFGAHGSNYAPADQVSVTSYRVGSGSYFCRPTK